MATDRVQLLRRLDDLGIAHTSFEHPPVYTVEDTERRTGPPHIRRSLQEPFPQGQAGRAPAAGLLNQRRTDLNRLAKALGCARLLFGRPELLEQVLGVAPGGVTPFALINDRALRMQPLLDRAMLACERLNYHRLTNAAITAIAMADLLRFMEACGHEPRILGPEATGITVA